MVVVAVVDTAVVDFGAEMVPILPLLEALVFVAAAVESTVLGVEDVDGVWICFI